MSVQASIPQRTDGRRYEAVLRLSEALSLCQEPEDLTKILSEQLREVLEFLQFYIVIYKENSTEVEWAVVGREKSLVSAYADVPVQQRPSWQAYTTQEPFHIADLNTDERVSGHLKQNLVAQGIETGPLVFVPLTTLHRRLGALGMSGQPGISYSSDDIGFLRLIGQVVAFAVDDNFNLRRVETANAELQRQNERLQRSERELREVIETIPCMAWSASADGAAQFFNRRWLDYAGLAADQVQNWGWTAAVHPDELNALVDYWRTVIASSQSGEIEARLRRFDGVYRWFLFRATPSFDDQGKVAKWYGTNTDIDDRKRAEQALTVQNNRLQLLLNLTNRITSNLDLREVLNAYEEVNREIPFDGLHWFFDHCETITDRNIERVKALGGGIAIQNRMAFQGEYFVERYGAEQAKRTPPIRRMLEIGVPVGAGTDATRVSSYNPYLSLYWLITGKTIGGLNLYPAENRLDREEALKLYTTGSSWFSTEDGKKGALAPGQLADLAVLSADYFSIPDEEIKQLESVLTIVGGKILYAAEEFSKLAPPALPVSPSWSPVKEYGGYAKGQPEVVGASHSASCSQIENSTARPAKSHLQVFGDLGLWGLGCDCFAF